MGAMARRAVVPMYTGRVVRFRSFAFLLALLLTATPVLGVVCEMDCDRPPASSECHQSTSSASGPTVRRVQHGCHHDHTTGRPAVLASASARDSVASVVAIGLPTLAHALLSDVRVAMLAMNGPPGVIGRSTSTIIILRI
jgi:hypothetical protein